MNDNLSQSQGASLTGNGDSLVSDGVCKQDTKPTHTSHSRTRYFSRLAQDLSHRVRNRCVSQNSHSSHLAQRVPRAFVFFLHTCVLPHFPHTLLSDLRPDHLPHLYLRLLHMEIYPAQIHRMCLSISWLKRSRLQVMSPRISLKRRTLYWSYRCSSTDRAWRRLMIQLRALRLSLQNPIWMMGEYVICWLYSCTYRREKQVPTDHDLITLSEKTQCQVHLTSEKSAGKPAAMFSHNRKSSLKDTFRQTNSPHLQRFHVGRKIQKTRKSACSGSPLDAMLWIKDVWMVASVDDLKWSRSIQGYTHFPNFEMLDVRVASALN